MKVTRYIYILLLSLPFTSAIATGMKGHVTTDSTAPLVIKKCLDFTPQGAIANTQWKNTEWQTLSKIDSGGKHYMGRSKMMYSAKGVYLLFEAEDDKITTKNYNDNEEIYEGDVFEVFFHPVPKQLRYFEYEINHLNKELILTLDRTPGKTLAWAPWMHEYKGDPLIKKIVRIAGGQAAVGASIKSWSAELFIPYVLLGLVPEVPPVSGTTWNANFCRIDYDSGKQVQWSWSKKIKADFHELQNFGTIIFE